MRIPSWNPLTSSGGSQGGGSSRARDQIPHNKLSGFFILIFWWPRITCHIKSWDPTTKRLNEKNPSAYYGWWVLSGILHLFFSFSMPAIFIFFIYWLVMAGDCKREKEEIESQVTWNTCHGGPPSSAVGGGTPGSQLTLNRVYSRPRVCHDGGEGTSMKGVLTGMR